MYHTHQFLGYLRVTDFGIARILKPENFQDTSGTPGYMGKLFINYILAPEVMWRQNHGIGVDYFAVGVIAYEWMFGKRPYVGRSRKEIRDHILSKQISIKKGDIPHGWTLEAADFINKVSSLLLIFRWFSENQVKDWDITVLQR